MKLIVSVNSLEHLNTLINKNIDGIMLSIDKLSVNDSFYIDVDMLNDIDFKEKEIFISLNKLMHNNDLDKLRKILNELKDMNVKILFYDMAVFNIAKEIGIVNKLVICQDHLNASTLSNKFYYDLGIDTSFITSDITMDELKNIKANSKSKIMFLAYGYQPIFYSRRYLISNYLDFIGKDIHDGEYKIVSDTDKKYRIVEEEFGTTIYTEKPINLLNYIDDIKEIDYLVLRSNMIDNSEYLDMIHKFINHDRIDNEYIGFFKTKTIYRVK